MLQLRPLDPTFPVGLQLSLDVRPVVLVNLFLLNKADEQAMLRAWTEDAQFMVHQPGFISTQLHRAIGDGCAYLNYATWESSGHFRAAFGNPQFQAKLSAYPSSVVASPHLFQRVAVPGICDA